jgi:putative spermidine/putrescine transport system permease protein
VSRHLLAFVNGVIYCFILAPILIIIPVSFSATQYVVFPPQGFSLEWYHNFFRTPEFVNALLLSLRLACSATAIASVLGVMAALAIVRGEFTGREWLKTFVMAPLIVPGLVLAIALLIFFSKTPLAGSFVAMLIAHVVVVLPYVIRTVIASLYGLDPQLEQAAMSLGGWPVVVFWTITLPLLKTGILAGAVLAFITSFDELIISLFLSGPNLTPLSVQIYNYIEFTSDPTIAAISVILIAFTTVIVLLIERTVGFTSASDTYLGM